MWPKQWSKRCKKQWRASCLARKKGSFKDLLKPIFSSFSCTEVKCVCVCVFTLLVCIILIYFPLGSCLHWSLSFDSMPVFFTEGFYSNQPKKKNSSQFLKWTAPFPNTIAFGFDFFFIRLQSLVGDRIWVHFTCYIQTQVKFNFQWKIRATYASHLLINGFFGLFSCVRAI